MKGDYLKTGILMLAFFLLCCLGSLDVKSQVTIGSNLPANKGALLDLKESSGEVNATKGLLLPRVALKHPKSMSPIIEDDLAVDAKKSSHIGLTVFNLTDDYMVDLCKGIYVWDYANWVRLPEPCCFPLKEAVISYPPSFNFKENENVDFHAFVSDPFGLDDSNIRYKWYIGTSEATDVEIPNVDGDYIVSLAVGMEYDGKQMSVKAYNKCSEIASQRYPITVTKACNEIQNVKIKSHPSRENFKFGVDKEVTFYAEVSGEPTISDFKYKWEWTVGGEKKESSEEHIVEIMTEAHNGVELKLTVSNACPSSATATQILTVYPCPTEELKFDVYPNADMSPTYTFTIHDLAGYTKEELADLGITIQWYKKQNKKSGDMWSGEWITDTQFVPIPGANDPKYVFNAVDYLGGSQDICDIGVKVTGNTVNLTDCPINNGYSYYRIMAQGTTGDFQATKPDFKTSDTPW